MNWLYNYYFGEGPGIPKDAPKPQGLRLLGQVLRREWWELIKLNLLFIAFSLPLVTLPAAYFATVSVCTTMLADRNVYLWRDFWTAFRSRFWPSTVLGVLLCGGTALSLLAIGTYADAAKESLIYSAPLAIAVLVSVLLPLFGCHAFVALAADRGRSVSDIFKASAIGLIARPLPGLAALAVVGVLWLAHVLFYPASVLLPVLINFSLGALVSSLAVRRGVEFGFSFCGDQAPRSTRGSTKKDDNFKGGEYAET